MAGQFWKLSMGPGATTNEFRRLEGVQRWIDRGVVLLHEDTGVGQGELFLEPDRVGDFFYLCHGNRNGTGIILLGRFTEPEAQLRGNP